MPRPLSGGWTEKLSCAGRGIRNSCTFKARPLNGLPVRHSPVAEFGATWGRKPALPADIELLQCLPCRSLPQLIGLAVWKMSLCVGRACCGDKNFIGRLHRGRRNLSESIWGPQNAKGHVNSILHFGSKASDKGDSLNHGLYDPCPYPVYHLLYILYCTLAFGAPSTEQRLRLRISPWNVCVSRGATLSRFQFAQDPLMVLLWS